MTPDTATRAAVRRDLRPQLTAGSTAQEIATGFAHCIANAALAGREPSAYLLRGYAVTRRLADWQLDVSLRRLGIR